MRGALVALALIAGPAFAEDSAESLSLVLSAQAVDLFDDHLGEERAVLALSPDRDALEADLYVFAGSLSDQPNAQLAYIPGIAYAGIMAGQSPWLERGQDGSLYVYSEQTGIGRSPWTMTVTLTQDNGSLMLTALTYDTWDRVTGVNSTCRWNLLSGDWTSSYQTLGDDEKSGQNFGKDARRLAAADWVKAGREIPDFCQS